MWFGKGGTEHMVQAVALEERKVGEGRGGSDWSARGVWGKGTR